MYTVMIGGKIDGRNTIAKWCNTQSEREAIGIMLTLSETGKPCNVFRGDVLESECYITKTGTIMRRGSN